MDILNQKIKPLTPIETITKFIIVTEDWSGLGWAPLLQDAKNPDKIRVIFAIQPKDGEDNPEGFDRVGNGMAEKILLDDIFKDRIHYKEYLWWFDQNHNSDKSEQLRKEGYYVLGGHALTDTMEHDRKFGVELIKRAGLVSPPTEEFGSIDDALNFLDEHEDTAYIFKPDEPDNDAWVTTVPEHSDNVKANRELYKFLQSQTEQGDFLLQERKNGVEVNVEFLVYKGKPFLAHANFECKKKDDDDLGRMIGCSQDIDFIIPLESKILRDTLGKLIKLPEFKEYTGRLDMNIIVADNEYWFLEFCAREGYNSSPNMFINLAIDPLSEILSDWVLGKTDTFGKHFRNGFGATVSCWIDRPVYGLPIEFDDDVASKFYHFDTFLGDDGYYTAGYSNEVGIVCAHDYDLKSAAEEALKNFSKVHYSGKTGRTDLARVNYLSNPQERYIAATAMKLFEKAQ